MRIAFVTAEFVTEYSDGGGLGNYLNRIGKLLVERGHQVEVFVPSHLEPRVLTHEGMRVERVLPFPRRLVPRMVRRILSAIDVDFPLSLFWQAYALKTAMEKRHKSAPFDLVQSADYLAVGLKIRRRRGRVHLVRCSTAVDLYNQVDGLDSKNERWRERLELAAIRRTERVYAPSQFLAQHYQNRYGIAVEVVRPPSGLEDLQTSIAAVCGLPERFFIHFGQLRRRKGTIWLAEALKEAFEVAPSLRMVWIGRGDFGELRRTLDTLGRHRFKVQLLYPLPKPDLYSVIRCAEAAVLPSLVDNLPNTVIECLTLGVPVIGTKGASIDELVESGVTGELVAPGDVKGLAAAMVRVWSGNSSTRKGFVWQGSVAEEMLPDRAIENLLRLAQTKASKKARMRDRVWAKQS